MLNKSRRTFIKGAAYTTLLTATGFTSLAMATDNSATTGNSTAATEIVTLINHTASSVTLDNISGIAIHELNDESVVTIRPGEESSFIVAAMSSQSKSANNKNLFITDVISDGALAINSDYPEFNGIYPVSLFKIQAV